MEEKAKCPNFKNPIDYVQCFILLGGTSIFWQVIHVFVNKMYGDLSKFRRKKIHDFWIEGILRLGLILLMAISGWRRMSYQLFWDVKEPRCWEFDLLCYLLTIVAIVGVYQMFFGIWTSKDSIIHHVILIYSIIDFVTNPQATDMLVGYYVIVVTAYGFLAFRSPAAIQYHVAMYHFKQTEELKYIIIARDAMYRRRLLSLINFILIWTICCGYYFIQAIFIEGFYKDLKFMLTRFFPFSLFYGVELYLLNVNHKIYQKKKAEVRMTMKTDSYIQNVEMSVEPNILLTMDTTHIRL